MISMKRRIVALTLILGLAGCSIFEYEASKPLVHRQADSAKGTDVFTIGAEKRVVLSQAKDSDRLFCSEPPPDVAQSFSDSLRAALQIAAKQQTSTNQSNQADRAVTPPTGSASAPSTNSSNSQQGGASQNTDANGSLNLARDFATSISQIYTRSQGVQLFRDGAFMLCQAHLNQALQGDRIEEKKKLAKARIELAQQLQLLELNAASPLVDQSKAAQQKPSTENLDRAAKALPDPQDLAQFNYSEKFTQLLNAVHSVLLVEIPVLYHTTQEQAKAATDAAATATTAKTQAAAAAAAASTSEANAGQLRDQAAQSAAKAADASTSATAASVAARVSADAAAASAKAAGSRAAPKPGDPAASGTSGK